MNILPKAFTSYVNKINLEKAEKKRQEDKLFESRKKEEKTVSKNLCDALMPYHYVEIDGLEVTVSIVDRPGCSKNPDVVIFINGIPQIKFFFRRENPDNINYVNDFSYLELFYVKLDNLNHINYSPFKVHLSDLNNPELVASWIYVIVDAYKVGHYYCK